MDPRYVNDLIALRTRHCLTQEELAFLLGAASGSRVYRIETGCEWPTLRALIALEAIFAAEGSEIFPEVYAEIERQLADRVQRLSPVIAGGRSRQKEAKLAALARVAAELGRRRVVQQRRRAPALLALSLSTRGIGFAVFRSPALPGASGMSGGHRRGHAAEIQAARDLIDRYRPAAVAIEDWAAKSWRRGARAARFLGAVERCAKERRIVVERIPYSTVREYFGRFGVSRKQDLVELIAGQLPGYASRKPRPRRPWETEHYWSGMYDAAALALTYYYVRSKVREAA